MASAATPNSSELHGELQPAATLAEAWSEWVLIIVMCQSHINRCHHSGSGRFNRLGSTSPVVPEEYPKAVSSCPQFKLLKSPIDCVPINLSYPMPRIRTAQLGLLCCWQNLSIPHGPLINRIQQISESNRFCHQFTHSESNQHSLGLAFIIGTVGWKELQGYFGR
jgi:hypothetical protein